LADKIACFLSPGLYNISLELTGTKLIAAIRERINRQLAVFERLRWFSP
jgi:hypothetical protein